MDPTTIYLAMQASGMIVDWFGKQDQMKLAGMGDQLNQASITNNIASSRLESEDQSLQSMKQLRMNLGSQLAVEAARGVRSGAGNSVIASNESVGNFNADERMRKINLSNNINNQKANSLISKLHTQTYNNDVTNQFRDSVLNRLPTSPQAWKGIIDNFSKSNNYGFGLTKVGT